MEWSTRRDNGDPLLAPIVGRRRFRLACKPIRGTRKVKIFCCCYIADTAPTTNPRYAFCPQIRASVIELRSFEGLLSSRGTPSWWRVDSARRDLRASQAVLPAVRAQFEVQPWRHHSGRRWLASAGCFNQFARAVGGRCAFRGSLWELIAFQTSTSTAAGRAGFG